MNSYNKSGSGRSGSSRSGSSRSGSGRSGSSRSGSGRSGFKKAGNRESGGYERRDSGGYRGKSGPPTMNEATCDKCGGTCSVPFKPSRGKPVYCSKCFRSQGDSSPSSRNDTIASEFDKINRKLDKLIKALEIE